MRLVNHTQGSDEWHAWRRGGIGGSDIAAIMGISPYKDVTRQSILEYKLGAPSQVSTFAMARGNRLEPLGRQWACESLGAMYRQACGEHDEYPWARCSFDGIGRADIIEVKAPDWETHDNVMSGRCPLYFEVQLQWAMFVSGLDVGHLITVSDNEKFGGVTFASVRVSADRWLQHECFMAAREFMRCINEAHRRPTAAS